MTDTTVLRDAIDDFDRVYLERLHLAATAILRLAEDDGVINDILFTELDAFRERIERALLLPPSPRASAADNAERADE